MRGGGSIGVGLVAFVAAFVLLTAPALAGVQTFFASPNGDGPFPCAKADPCPIVEAVDQASDDDVISLSAGTYDLGAEGIDLSEEVTLHGPKHGKPARVVSSDGIAIDADQDSNVTDLVIEATDGTAVSGDTGKLERIRATANAAGNTCHLPIEPGFLRNSTCVNTGPGWGLGVSVFAGTTITRSYDVSNVTAVANGGDGNSAALRVISGGMFTADVHVSNSILKGGPAASSIAAENSGASAHSNVAVDHTNYTQSLATSGSQVTSGAGNQGAAAPLFVSATDGDYRQLPGSPTINAGTKDNGFLAIGPFDFTGEKRASGPKPDIGADEFIGVLKAKASVKQKLAKLKVKATCLLTACKLKARGTIKVGTGRDQVKGKLKQASARGSAGKTRTLRLRLRRADRFKVGEALKRHSGKASIVVNAKGGHGTRGSKRLRVKVR